METLDDKLLELECPSCSKSSYFVLPICKHCGRKFFHFKYAKVVKASKATLVAIGVAGAIGYAASDYLQINRYKAYEEFNIINLCLNGSGNEISSSDYSRKAEICACALEYTQKEYSLKDKQEQESNYTKRFRVGADKCMSQPHH